VAAALLPLLVLVGIAACKGRQDGEPGSKAVIHYIPCSVQTMIATTPDNIEKQAFNKFVLDVNDVQLRRLVETLDETQAGSFDARVVRLKVDLPSGQIFLVDADGGARSFSGERRLTATAFVRLKGILTELSRGSSRPGR
jgi:hypothetical protein